MTWGEAFRLTRVLSADPGAELGAALADWSHPASREALVFMDLFDLQHTSKAKRRPRPYPRPWADPSVRHWGRASLAPDELVRLLTQHREEGSDG